MIFFVAEFLLVLSGIRKRKKTFNVSQGFLRGGREFFRKDVANETVDKHESKQRRTIGFLPFSGRCISQATGRTGLYSAEFYC